MNNDVNDDFDIQMNVDEAINYDLPLVSFSKDNFEIAFANLSRENKNGKTIISIENIAAIEAKKMKLFLSVIINAMVDYEDKFKNGYGLKKRSRGENESF